MTETGEATTENAPATADRQDLVVSVRNLNYTIGEATILADVSFDVSSGEIFGIMGMSGSGKTTLLRLLMALISPDSGEIIVHGEDITQLNEDGLNRVRTDMGMCFQYAALFDSLTVAGNVAFALRKQHDLPREEVNERVAQLLDVVDMEGTEERMPSEMSGGMKKRVGIARALIEHPSLMLYDEPTSGLDPVMAGIISNLIKQVRDEFGSTAIVVSHDVGSLFSIADRVLMLHGHKVVAIGTPTEMYDSDSPAIKQFVAGEVSGPLTETLALG